MVHSDILTSKFRFIMGFYSYSSCLLLFLALIAFHHVLCGAADPTDGFTQVPLTERNFQLQKPYNLPLDQRYSYEDGIRKLWVYSNDKSFHPGGTTKPRTEIQISGLDYTSGVWQFEGYTFVPSGTSAVSIVQIHGITEAATCLQLRMYDGDVTFFDYNTVAKDLYNKWFRVNVIHDVDQGKLTVYINGARFSFKTSVTMCSSESAVSSPVYIGVNSSDQEVVISLERIIDGAALPADVITDVNAYNSTPWELLDGIWYFSTLEEPKATECGYWKVTGECHRISTNSSTIGSRLTLEFYTGQPPYGIKTNWVMHDYRINQKGLCEISNAKVFPSLCRVFLSCSRSSNHEEEQNNVANGMSVEKNVENKEILQHCTSRSQVKRASECGPLADSKRHLEDPRSDYPIQDPHESCDFSENDFILLQDLDNPLSAFGNPRSSFSSSTSSSLLSLSSGEYFDPSAMLRALDSRPCHDMEAEYPDAKFSVSAPMRPDQVVVRPESLGSFICFLRSGENLVQDYSPPVVALEQNNEASMNVPCVQSDVKPSSSSGDSLVQDTSLPTEATKQNSEASKSVRFLPTDESLRPTPKPEEVSPSTSGGHAVVLPTEESKATKSRVKKLGQVKRRGKKYWCFVPF